MDNGLMTSSSLCRMKYLSEFFAPYDSFLEASRLLTSMSSILNSSLLL